MRVVAVDQNAKPYATIQCKFLSFFFENEGRSNCIRQSIWVLFYELSCSCFVVMFTVMQAYSSNSMHSAYGFAENR